MARVWLTLSLLLGAVLMRGATEEPRPVPASAPAGEFSSARAMADVRVIAAAPHPVGSPANARVRDYLVGRMTALGLSPRVQRDTGMLVEPGGHAAEGSDVENVIGVLPGRDRAAPALALMAHYDSAPASPGAGDDAAGVASVLETVRAIKARGAPARDVVVLITDGEEPGLLGAQAFFARDPMAAHIGLVINLEARGGAGRAAMFETSAGNGGLIAALQGAARSPNASSLANTVYSRMPNGTDLTIVKQAGKAGMNFAFLGGQFDYHSPTATAANLHEGSVQSMGAQVLAIADRFAFGALPEPRPDVVFSQALGSVIVAYPPWAGWFALAAILGLGAAGAVRAHRTAPLRWSDVGLGAAASIGVLVVAAGLLWLARAAVGAPMGYIWQAPLLARQPLWETAMALIGAASLLAVYGLMARRDHASIWLGALIPAAVAAVAMQAAAPLDAYLSAWPMAIAALGAAVTALGRDERWPSQALLTVMAAVGLGWLGALAHFLAVAMDQPALLGVFVWLAALSLWPLLGAALSRRLALIASGALLAGAVILIAGMRITEAGSPRYPQPSVAYYVADRDAGRFWLASPAADRSTWTKTLLRQGTGPAERRALPPLLRSARAAPARAVATPPYSLALTQTADCAVSLNAPGFAGARALTLQVDLTAPASTVSLGGRPADLLRDGHARLVWRRADQGVALSFRPSAAGKAVVRYALVLDHWPGDAQPLPPRSASQMPFGDSDALVLTGSASLDTRAC